MNKTKIMLSVKLGLCKKRDTMADVRRSVCVFTTYPPTCCGWFGTCEQQRYRLRLRCWGHRMVEASPWMGHSWYVEESVWVRVPIIINFWVIFVYWPTSTLLIDLQQLGRPPFFGRSTVSENVWQEIGQNQKERQRAFPRQWDYTRGLQNGKDCGEHCAMCHKAVWLHGNKARARNLEGDVLLVGWGFFVLVQTLYGMLYNFTNTDPSRT